MFSDHIQLTKGKVSRGLGILYKAKWLLKQKTLLTLYHSFIYPYFTYCISVWGNTYKTHLSRLIKLQKRAIRLLCREKWDAPSQPLFKKLNLLTIQELYLYSVQIFNYKFMHKILPETFWNFFTYNCDIHNYNTRQSHHFHSRLSKTKQISKNIRTTGISINNHFMKYVSHNCTLTTYKKHIKSYILSNDLTFLIES